MLISPAHAQAAAGGGGDIFIQLLPLILIFVVFYFLLIRPQQKRMKEHRLMLEALRRGDRIVTGGGIIGTITKAGDQELKVKIADGVEVEVMRGTVTNVVSKTEPAANDTQKSKSDAPAEGDKKGGFGGLFGKK